VIISAVLLGLVAQHIQDDAGIIHPREEELALGMIRKVKESHSADVSLVTVSTLDGRSIDDFARGLTQPGPRGVVMVIAVKERETRILVGAELKGVLSPAVCDRIIREELAPSAQWGRTGDGAFAALAAVVGTIKGTYSGRPVRPYRRRRLFPGWLYAFGVAIWLIAIHRKLGEFGGGFAIGNMVPWRRGHAPGWNGRRWIDGGGGSAGSW
jgi:uncharacterized protein